MMGTSPATPNVTLTPIAAGKVKWWQRSRSENWWVAYFLKNYCWLKDVIQCHLYATWSCIFCSIRSNECDCQFYRLKLGVGLVFPTYGPCLYMYVLSMIGYVLDWTRSLTLSTVMLVYCDMSVVQLTTRAPSFERNDVIVCVCLENVARINS